MGQSRPGPSTQSSIDYFRSLDHVGGPPTTTQLPDRDPPDGSTAELQRWFAPRKRTVDLITIHGGGHAVPHPATHGPRLLGNTNAAEAIWEFFERAP